MANSYFQQNRSYFHTFSRAFSMKGQNFVDQAPLKSGHNLGVTDIRAQAIPFIAADFTLAQEETPVSILQGETGSRTVIDQYKDILKFYDGVELTALANTNNQTYQLVVDGKTIMGFIDPTDKFSSDGTEVAQGYTMFLLDGNDKVIPAAQGQTWTFDPYNGTVQFANGQGPANHSSWGSIKIRAFAYTGKKLDTALEQAGIRYVDLGQITE